MCASRLSPLPRFLFPTHFKTDFTIHNLPFGVFSTNNTHTHKIGVAIGDKIIDCSILSKYEIVPPSLGEQTLNSFMSEGKEVWTTTRNILQELLSDESPTSLTHTPKLLEECVISQDQVVMHTPAHIGDYTDFYASKQHASHLGEMFRGKENSLTPNWLHIPIGYHGRSSSIFTSGQAVHRPFGQQNFGQNSTPIFQPSQKVDFELEMGAFVGPGNKLGNPISIKNSKNNIFGLVLLNDWSARDIQKWEYQPLGPFLAKNFGTIISPWVVTLDALEPFKCKGPVQSPTPLPYLRHEEDEMTAYDINLEVDLTTKNSHTFNLTKTNFKLIYWSIFQQLTHHSSSGCNLKPGDLLGSGTISGDEKGSYGCLQELTWGGSNTINFPNGEKRTFLEDFDEITMKAYCEKDNIRIGFGNCKSQILPPVEKFF